MDEFHFLRPWFFVLLPLGLLMAGWIWRYRGDRGLWRRIGDPELVRHLLIGQASVGSRLPILLFALMWMLLCLSLAGPAWQRVEVPVLQSTASRVVVLDLSVSMLSNDLKPSRLQRAKFVIQDYLQLYREGQVGLVVFAGGAHIVTPLTDDDENIRNLLPVLQPDIMPAQGSRVDLGIDKAMELLSRTGVSGVSEILLLADGVAGSLEQTVNRLREKDINLDIIAVGTEKSGPILLPAGGFLTDTNDKPVLPAVEASELRAFAGQVGGRFFHLQNDPLILSQRLPVQDTSDAYRSTARSGDVWQDIGPWLVVVCIPLFLLLFRRGWMMVFCLVFSVMPLSSAEAWNWNDLWLRSDQQARQALAAGDAESAARVARRQDWRGSARYRSGDYPGAANDFSQIQTADGYYNHGNALAKSGNLEGAVQSYERALGLRPGMADAVFNRDLVQRLLQQNNPQPQQDPGQEANSNDQSNQKGEQSNDNRPTEKTSKPASGDDDKREEDAADGPGSPSKSDHSNEPDEPIKEAEHQPGESAEESNKPGSESTLAEATAAEDPRNDLGQQALTQWLRQIPDDPGGLMRRKFLYQYRLSSEQPAEDQPW